MEIGISFEFEELDDTVVLTPLINLGELKYDQIERDGKRVLEQWDSTDAKHVVVDLAKTDYYGSTALEFFVKLWRRARTRGGQLAFCNVSPHEREVLELTRFDRLWSICETRSEALGVVQVGDAS